MELEPGNETYKKSIKEKSNTSKESKGEPKTHNNFYYIISWRQLQLYYYL